MSDTHIAEVGAAARSAKDALWEVYKRPKAHGGEWGDLRAFTTRAQLHAHIRANSGWLYDRCRLAMMDSGPKLEEGERQRFDLLCRIHTSSNLQP